MHGIKCGVAVGITASSRSLPVQNLFPYPVLLAAISVVIQRRAVSSMSSRSLALSKVNSVRSLWNRVAIDFTVEKVISASGLGAAIWNRWSTSSDVYDVDVVISRSVVVDNVG